MNVDDNNNLLSIIQNICSQIKKRMAKQFKTQLIITYLFEVFFNYSIPFDKGLSKTEVSYQIVN